jgi:hypothetical protein
MNDRSTSGCALDRHAQGGRAPPRRADADTCSTGPEQIGSGVHDRMDATLD